MIRLAIGVTLGAVAMWIYLHREEIGLVYSNRDRLSGAAKIYEGFGEVFQ